MCMGVCMPVSLMYPPRACSEGCLVVCNTPSTSTRHTYTHTHTPAVLEYLSEVSWLGLRLGTALPNHIAASKSSVYISNYIVARGVLEHSGRSPFHLCAVSTPPACLISSLSSLRHPYFFFISISLIFVVVSVDCALSNSTHLPTDLRPLNSASQGKADRRGQRDHLWWSVYCPAPICRGSQYNINPSMHNSKDQSWVKDNSKEYCLGLDYRAGTQTL